MHPGAIAGIIGSIVGVVGGIVGTYVGVRNTTSPQERRFVIRWAIGAWVAVALLLTGLFLLPHPYNALLWIPYSILLFFSVRAMNRGQARLRAKAVGRRG